MAKRKQRANPVIDKYGTKWWYNQKREFHRLDGPAIEWPDGSREWHVDGKHHRLDGPAVEEADGTRIWYLNGELHRMDGPAVERADGTRMWFINGSEVNEEDHPFVKILNQYNLYSKWENNELTEAEQALIKLSV